ncbi:MAG: LytTR family DNA-binding domain-containing protein [Bacteroidota bacterium]
MTCIIIEDQPPAQRILWKYIEDMGGMELRGTFKDALEALDVLNNERIDLMFLDIHLPKLYGTDFLKSLTDPPTVILTTAFPDYALEGYELDVIDYLLKPFSFQRFVKAVNKAQLAIQARDATLSLAQPSETLFVKSGYEHIKLNTQDLLFIRADGEYTRLVESDRKILATETLKQWLERLEHLNFAQVHKSYIVNLSSVEKISGNQLYVKGGEVIPIGRAYKDRVTKFFL